MAVTTPSEVMTPDQPRPMMDVTNPVTGELVGQVPRQSPAEVAAAVEKARAAQMAWGALPFRQRAGVFKRFHDLILDRGDELYDVIQSETGKSRRDAFIELFAVAAEARYYAYHGGRALRSNTIAGAIPFRERVRIVHQPVGVVGIISPWNFPFILTAGEAVAPLLAGNAVVLKPASLTPLTALWAADRLAEAGLPEDLFQVVTGSGSVLGNALIDQVDMIAFTGSSDVGQMVAARAGRNLIPATMELGSKNAVIVLPDADLKHTVQVVIEGSFCTAGQACIDYERAYVHVDVYDRFLAELVRQTRQLRMGSTGEFDTDVGTLISADQLETVEAHVMDAQMRGAQVLVGGNRRPDLGPYFYEPTVLVDVPCDAIVHKEETFGPVLSVYPIQSVDEAIVRANKTRYGLHFAVATGDRRLGEAVARRLEAGSVAINDSYYIWGAMGAPMGGFKHSGIGRRHGPDGIRKYTEPQSIQINQTRWQINSGETALAVNERLAKLLVRALKIWRHIPFLR